MINLIKVSTHTVVIFVILVGLIKNPDYFSKNYASKQKNEISKELNPYIDKFFRDLNNHGIYPVIPTKFIMKFSSLDSHKSTSHVHGLSLGFEDDEKVEIYINKNSWNSFNKTQKHYIVYHELSHDILNLDDLDDSDDNYGKIMFPYISRYSGLKMNDFIENMKNLFKSIK